MLRPPHASRAPLPAGLAALALLAAGGAGADPVELEVVASSAALGHAARQYQSIWEEFGERIVLAFESRTCLPFAEARVGALIADAGSHSGGPDHPMRLRASYDPEVKRSTLVHELGHRHLWQLVERIDDVDGHRTLYLILDRVWADVWGEAFAEDRIRGESDWLADYDYAAAWDWARALTPDERLALWNRLLTLNGMPGGCDGPIDGPQ